MSELGIGLIGTGFMGKTHARAFGALQAVFGNSMGHAPAPRLELLCDTPLGTARNMADQFGFARATDDWEKLINDPRVDVVSITTPNHLHYEMFLAAVAAGKHVYCEKPLALTLGEAKIMAAAATKANVKTIIGYNYLKNPIISHAQRLIANGDIGEIVHFRGWVDEDYQADPKLSWTWRATISQAGLGALGDLGCHLVSMAYAIAGPIESLIADTQIIHKTRPLADQSGFKTVENEDTASALLRFKNGAHGSLGTSRSAWGRKNRLAWEAHGTKGMICFDQERMNELQIYKNTGALANQGFQTILSGPAHAPFGEFCPAPGHQLGFNDLKIIEAAQFLNHIGGGPPSFPNVVEALEFEKVIHAIVQSANSQTRISII